MTEPNSNIDSWMNEITTKTETLKVQDGETKRFVFLDSGKRKESVDYGISIAFLVQPDGEDKPRTLYVKSNNFDLLGQIKSLAKSGSLVGIHVELSRKGSKRSDTRYTIKLL